jgi:hypothetical protein
MTLGGGQIGLRGGRADAPHGGDDWKLQEAGEILRLVEAALAPARRVERDRNNTGGALEEIGAADAHQPRQRPGQRSASLVFESVDDSPQRPVMGANGARLVDEARSATAARASRQRHADRTPGRQGIAAPIAERGCQRQNRRPARRADWTARRLFEQTVAGGAGWRQDDGENGVEGRARCTGDRVSRSHQLQ